MSITDSIREYAHDKGSKLQRYFSRISHVEIILDLEGGVPVVEIVARAARGSTFIARHRDEDMYACIDKAAGKVEEQIRRHKDKVRDHKAVPRGQSASSAAAEASDEDDES